MNLAFCLFKYYPYGGLERDFLRIALACQQRGHSIRVFTMKWEGPVPNGFEITQVPVRNWTNHRRCDSFARALSTHLTPGRFDATMGFNKMPHLDLYFAADPCYKARVFEERSVFYRWSRRCRTYLKLEEAVFSPAAKTEILLLAEPEKERYIHHYGTPDARFHLVPAGIARDRQAPLHAEVIRRQVREEFGLSDLDYFVLIVGSDFRRKGLDRALRALSGLSADVKCRTHLFVLGRGQPNTYLKLARRLGVAERVRLLGGRDDVPRFLLAADVLLHPAYTETAGMVLLEALASGLPVLATDVCGYAFHIERSQGGQLAPSPFVQEQLSRLLEEMLLSPQRATWKQNALQYVARTDIFSLPEKAADWVEHVARERKVR